MNGNAAKISSVATTLGMPVQVFPSGPPPPPPMKSQLSPNTNGNRSPSLSRKSPQPQSLEPLPLGLRPDIKNMIPANPMASLKKVGEPKPKNDFWVEEYRKENSKSPMPTDSLNTASTQSQNNEESKPVQEVKEVNNNRENENCKQQASDQNNNNVANTLSNGFGNTNAQRIYSPFSTTTSSPQPNNLPKPLTPIKLNQNESENVPIYLRSSQRAVSPKPISPLVDEQKRIQSPSLSNLQKQSSFDQTQAPVYTRTQRNVTASPVRQFNPANQTSYQSQQQYQNQNDLPTENAPIYMRSFQKPNNANAPQNTAQHQPLSTAQQSFNNDPGRQYYQPNQVKTPTTNEQDVPLANQKMPQWMMRRTNSKEIPEWANNVETYDRPNVTSQNNNAQQANTNANQLYSTTNGNSQYANSNNYGENKVSSLYGIHATTIK